MNQSERYCHTNPSYTNPSTSYAGCACCSSVIICGCCCRSVYLDRLHADNTAEQLCEHDPQLPQGFTALPDPLTFRPGDKLRASCNFSSLDQTEPVSAGATHANEMCNLYMMLYGDL